MTEMTEMNKIYDNIHKNHEYYRNMALDGKDVGNKGLIIGSKKIINFLRLFREYNDFKFSNGSTYHREDSFEFGRICHNIKNIHNIIISRLVNSNNPVIGINYWIIAGGYLVNIIKDVYSAHTDIDLFPKNISNLNKLLQETKKYYRSEKNDRCLKYDIIDTSYSMTIKSSKYYNNKMMPIQFIKAGYKNYGIGNLLYPFDLSIAGFAYDYKTKKLYATLEAIFELYHNTIFMYPSRLSSSYESRALKYVFHKHLSLHIPNVYRNFINPNLLGGVNKIITCVEDYKFRENNGNLSMYHATLQIETDNNFVDFLIIIDYNKSYVSGRMTCNNAIIYEIKRMLRNYISYKYHIFSVENITNSIIRGESEYKYIKNYQDIKHESKRLINVFIKSNMKNIYQNKMTPDLMKFCDMYKIKPIQILKFTWDRSLVIKKNINIPLIYKEMLLIKRSSERTTGIVCINQMNYVEQYYLHL
jgi:hypothetical protein